MHFWGRRLPPYAFLGAVLAAVLQFSAALAAGSHFWSA